MDAEAQLIIAVDDCERKRALREVIALYTHRYGKPVYGSTRAVFYDGEHVHKVPSPFSACSGCAGVFANLNECSNYVLGKAKIAPCKIYYHEQVPIIHMKRLELKPESEYPRWILDCPDPAAGVDERGDWHIYDGGWTSFS